MSTTCSVLRPFPTASHLWIGPSALTVTPGKSTRCYLTCSRASRITGSPHRPNTPQTSSSNADRPSPSCFPNCLAMAPAALAPRTSWASLEESWSANSAAKSPPVCATSRTCACQVCASSIASAKTGSRCTTRLAWCCVSKPLLTIRRISGCGGLSAVGVYPRRCGSPCERASAICFAIVMCRKALMVGTSMRSPSSTIPPPRSQSSIVSRAALPTQPVEPLERSTPSPATTLSSFAPS
jgi:hypothetical protein